MVQQLSETHEWLIEPAEIFGYRKNPTTNVWEVLVGWKGLPTHEATWELFDDFKQQFPAFLLEDKVALEGESSIGPHIILIHNRKGNKGKGIVCGSVASTSQI